jgi:hypothetical protein
MPNLNTIRAQVRKALDAYAQELERRAEIALRELAQRHPESTVTFCSAMGRYDFSVDQDTVSMPIINAFDSAQNDYGWGAIPAPVRMEIRNGKFEKLTNW